MSVIYNFQIFIRLKIHSKNFTGNTKLVTQGLLLLYTHESGVILTHGFSLKPYIMPSSVTYKVFSVLFKITIMINQVKYLSLFFINLEITFC